MLKAQLFPLPFPADLRGDLVAQPDLAEKLGRSLSTLRYWRHIGHGPRSFKIGGRVVYKLEDVEQWIEAQYNDDTAGRVAG